MVSHSGRIDGRRLLEELASDPPFLYFATVIRVILQKIFKKLCFMKLLIARQLTIFLDSDNFVGGEEEHDEALPKNGELLLQEYFPLG